MLGGTSRWDLLGSRPAGDKSNLDAYVRALGQNGFKLVMLGPSIKEPIDVRTTHMVREDDAAAQEVAKAAGDPRWAEVQTKAGIKIATSDPDRLVKYVKRAEKQYGEPPNLAMVADRSFIAIDIDHAEGVEAFRAAYKAATGEDVSPTVLTPGVQNEDGTWKHKGGAHFYFELPPGYVLPANVSVLKVGEGKESWTIFVEDRYFLIPPSVRAEGPYRWLGGVTEAPAHLLKDLAEEAERLGKIAEDKALRAAQRAASGPSNVDSWAAGTDWASLLEPDGWFFTGSRTACGCPEVTAPGPHASPKSATAHEPGCRQTDTGAGHGPLHIWTDNPPAGIAEYVRATGSTTLTMLQYVAWMHRGGDTAAAIKALGISSGTLFAARTGDELRAEAGIDVPESVASEPVPSVEEEGENEVSPEPNDKLDDEEACSPSSYLPPDLPEAFRKRGFNPQDKEMYPLGFPGDPELVREIFDFSEITRYLFHHARNLSPKAAPPIPVLLNELVRRGMRCPVTVRPYPGTPLSTNAVRAGRSGTGKTKADSEEARPWSHVDAPPWLVDKATKKVDPPPAKQAKPLSQNGTAQPIAGPSAPVLIPPDFDATIGLGSGQVLADHLTEKLEGTGEKGTPAAYEMRPHPAVHVSCDELTTLLRASKNEKSDPVPTLCTAWAGAPFGDSTRGSGNSRTNGFYNVFVTGGIQPSNAHHLLELADHGFPQRAVFCSTADPYKLLNEPAIPDPGFVAAPMPIITPTSKFTLDQQVKDDVEKAVEDSYFDHLPNPQDELESHLMQVRLRIACLGALLHGTLHVSADLWSWTAWIVEHSRRTLAWMHVETERSEGAEDTGLGVRRAVSRAAEDAHTEEMVYETSVVVLSLISKVGANGLTFGRIKSNLVGSKQKWLPRALPSLISRGQIYQDGSRFKIKPAEVKAS